MNPLLYSKMCFLILCLYISLRISPEQDLVRSLLCSKDSEVNVNARLLMPSAQICELSFAEQYF